MAHSAQEPGTDHLIPSNHRDFPISILSFAFCVIHDPFCKTKEPLEARAPPPLPLLGHHWDERKVWGSRNLAGRSCKQTPPFQTEQQPPSWMEHTERAQPQPQNKRNFFQCTTLGAPQRPLGQGDIDPMKKVSHRGTELGPSPEETSLVTFPRVSVCIHGAVMDGGCG